MIKSMMEGIKKVIIQTKKLTIIQNYRITRTLWTSDLKKLERLKRRKWLNQRLENNNKNQQIITLITSYKTDRKKWKNKDI